ncbi:Ankyrin repeat and SOCS box protein 3 [Colletotrichum orbiculare MAFF 240422]|uniref:Ankyrin repeat and SOCS box protein 3 n=1 Tax=Colletotrichum orbiculare (strain 104-T / ATCC 96160 / CBS 514.97 / LARS 414 / MAFF 240422) TaxID=1213857 RepID=A0A484FMT6_COLOR|nr:Ankyrin repeat and SOCS box protein 3 [Colletotrichum orbiculare MAFF 240422]
MSDTRDHRLNVGAGSTDRGSQRPAAAASLPPEVIDAVIDQIDNHLDLLRMACLCRSHSDYALKIYYQRYFQSHGLPFVSRLLWPGTHYDDPLKDEPSAQDEAHALLVLRRGTPFCDPNEMWHHQAPNAHDISYLYFRHKGGIGTGYCFGRYPILHLAAYSGLDSIVEHLVESGADVNAIPLQHVSEEDVVLSHLTPLFMAAYGGSSNSARILLDHGARIENSWVAALQSGNGDVVQLLIDREPKLVKDDIVIHDKRMNALSAAVDFCEGDPVPVVRTLLANGADTTYTNAYSRNMHEGPALVQVLVASAREERAP